MEGAKSEYVFSSEDPQRLFCLDERSSFCISKSIVLKKAAKIIHDSLRAEIPKVAKWPPTPHDIMEEDMGVNLDLFNLLAWIVHPASVLDCKL